MANNKPCSDETRRKISESQKERWRSGHYQRHFTDERKEVMRKATIGKHPISSRCIKATQELRDKYDNDLVLQGWVAYASILGEI